MNTFGSLVALEEQLWDAYKRRPIVPIDQEWFDYSHRNESQSYVLLLSHLHRLREGRVGTACKDVFAHAAAGVVWGKPTDFMGPMCCPLTRSNLAYVLDDAREYLVTEKSDGIRCMAVNLWAPRFPRWLVPPQPPQGAPRSLPLSDVGVLEEARHALLQHNRAESAPLQLTISPAQPLVLHMAEGEDGHERLSLRPDEGAGAAPAAAAQQHGISVTRSLGEGRYFLYLFDRSLSGPHLLMEEYCFPAVGAAVLDGELLWTIASPSKPQRLVYAAFDLISYSPRADWLAAAAKPVVQQPRHGFIASPVGPLEILSRRTMKERYDLIQSIIMEPFLSFYNNSAIPIPRTFTLYRKRMFGVAELPLLLQDLGRSADGTQYTYRGETYNDGLVFTPNVFDLVAGAKEDQLKWKWPDKLTVDWRLTPQKSSKGEFYKIEMYFKKKKFNEADVVGLTTLGVIPVANPKRLDVPACGCVAECGWDAGLGQWRMEEVRVDKQEPNAVITILSVLESMCEQIDLPTLTSFFPFGKGKVLLRELGAAPREIVPVAPVPLILRAMHEDGSSGAAVAEDHDGAMPIVLKLQWQVQLPGLKNPVTCNHVPVRKCFGMNQPCPESHPTSRLAGQLAIHLANDGGCHAWSDTSCVCQFDPTSGRWGILGVGHDKDKAYATAVVRHLQEIANVVLKGNTVAPRPELYILPSIAAADQPLASPSTITPPPSDGVRGDVVGHYAARTKELKDRPKSTRSLLRRHNNWIKSVLIAQAVAAATISGAKEKGDGKLAVLDLCCGRGGDLHKWKNHPLRFLMMIDSCFEAVAAAAERYCVTKGLSTRIVSTPKNGNPPGIPASFHELDCFSAVLRPVVEAQKALRPHLKEGFDIVSCQFSMHYAFNSDQRVHELLRNICTSLRVGGLYVGTTVDDGALKKWRETCGDDFGNNCFHFSLVPPAEAVSTRGVAYRFTHEESVADAVEYVVDWDWFVDLAASPVFGLELLFSHNFSDYRAANEATDEGQRLWVEMSRLGGPKRDSAGDEKRRSIGDELSSDELETAALFRVFCFRKVPQQS